MKKCLNCGRKINGGNKTRIYCNDECSHFYRDRKHKKAALQSKLELERKRWCNTSVGMMWKFYDIFGYDLQCNLCGLSLDDNIDQYGTPLHFTLRDGVNNYRALDINSWQIYCTRCFLKINEMKVKSNS